MAPREGAAQGQGRGGASGRKPSPQGLGEGDTWKEKDELGEMCAVGTGGADGSRFRSRGEQRRQNGGRDVLGSCSQERWMELASMASWKGKAHLWVR